MVELLEAENKEVEAQRRTLEAERGTLWERFYQAEFEIDDKNREINRLLYQERQQREEALHQKQLCAVAEARLKKFASLDKLPESIDDCCRFFADAYPDRIAFTGGALESAKESDYPKIPAVWNALWHMAETLHGLAFDDDGRINLESAFRSRTGIKFSLNEGNQTKSNKRLRDLRSVSFNGEEIDITPHIKLQTGNQYFRFYFNINTKRRLLIVGYCGHHETAGTMKRH